MRSITIKGFDDFQTKLRNLPKQLESEVDFAVGDAAGLWEQKAKQAAPVDQGPLRAMISVVKPKIMNREVVSPLEYSPFMEWGTKSKVRVPADLQSYAAQWKGVTSPGGAKAIYDWARRVGIPQNQWVFVYLSIMKYGVNPHPFFFEHKPVVEKQLFTDLKQILETEH